jgi:protein-S-isoprenylcysteine O-methyltransferase Ste14
MIEEISTPIVYARIILTIIAFGTVLFVSAGTVYWIEGWAFTIIFSVYVVLSTVWLMKNNPTLLKERLRTRKTQKWDRIILSLFAICFVPLLVLPGIDFRYQWTPFSFPIVVQLIAFFGLSISFFILFSVTKENTYASKAIKIQEEVSHTVVTTGPYKYVRHPLYAGGILTLVCMPVALCSFYSLIPSGLCVVLFGIRTYCEDKMLYNELPGYSKYTQETPYRLIPGIW